MNIVGPFQLKYFYSILFYSSILKCQHVVHYSISALLFVNTLSATAAFFCKLGAL